MPAAGSKPASDAAVELGEVRPEAAARVGIAGIGRPISTSPAVSSRSTSRIAATSCVALRGVERLEERPRQLVAAAVEHRALGRPRAASARAIRARAGPPPGRHRDEPGGLERAQQPAQVARVEVEPRAQLPQLAALGADLPQQPRLAERAVASEERSFSAPTCAVTVRLNRRTSATSRPASSDLSQISRPLQPSVHHVPRWTTSSNGRRSGRRIGPAGGRRDGRGP